jgi:parallel beta-helix repeat protein
VARARPQAQAATSYYVSTSGNDSNAGTLAAPWRTLGKAAEVAGPSDTVYVRAGTYSGGVWLGRTGSDSAWITFRNYPGERPVLQGGSTGTEAVGIGGQYYEINGFEIAGPSRAGISVWGGKHIRLRNNVIHGTYWGGIFTGNGASDVTADGNTVYDTVLINRNEAGNWREAIAIGGDDNRAINNYVYENYGEGIGVYGNRAYAAGNVVRDSYGANIYVNNVRNATVERNFTYTTYASAFYRTLYGVRGPAMGIQFANELTPAEDPNQLDNLKVLNNIFLGGIYAMHYWNGMGGGGIKNSVIAGNTFVEGSKEVNSVLNIQSDAGHTNTVIADNIFTSTDGSGIADWEVAPSLAGLSFSHNLWNVGTKPSRLSGTGDVIADPKLVKPHGTTAADYKLQAGSPAIDKGRAVPGLTEDFFRTTRPKGAAPDIGAHEHTAATTPTPTPTPTPTATPTPTPTATPTATPTPTATRRRRPRRLPAARAR